MTKLLIGYLAVCIAAAAGAVLVLLAAGGFGETGIGLYGKIALALLIILIVVGGMALLVMFLARTGSHPDAAGRDADARAAPPDRRDGSRGNR